MSCIDLSPISYIMELVWYGATERNGVFIAEVYLVQAPIRLWMGAFLRMSRICIAPPSMIWIVSVQISTREWKRVRRLWWLFILLGVLVIAAPTIMEWYADHEQDRLLQAIEHQEAGVDQQLASSYSRLSDYLQEGESAEDLEPEARPLALPDEEGLLGMIEIDSIDVKLPILEGATKENLRSSAVHMSETTSIGTPGNAAIAAHRARTTGRLFNRLDEVELGDNIAIHTREGLYQYEVYEILVVEPTDLSVLDHDGSESLLTLITCTPLNVSSHRLIVHAKLV